MNVLALGAHPDDVEISCAGTLAKYASAGHKVFIATATNGNIGSAVMDFEETARVRQAEAKKSAAIIGAEYICLDFDDEYLTYDMDTRLKFIDLVRYTKADIILTHYPHDYLTDHDFTGKIANDIIVLIPIAKIKTPNPPCDKQPSVYFFETARGLNFTPTDYVDISDFYETKKQMLLCHDSQKQWLTDNKQYASADEEDFLREMRIKAEFRGMQCGTRYAEGFIRSTDAFRITADRLLP